MISDNLKDFIFINKYDFIIDLNEILLRNEALMEDIFEISKKIIPEIITSLHKKCENKEISYNLAFNYIGKHSVALYTFYLMVKLLLN